MMEYLACFLFGAVVALVGVRIGIDMTERTPVKTDVEQKAETQAEDDRDDQRRSKEIDEGIQNLMTFSVNGSDGFDAGGL